MIVYLNDKAAPAAPKESPQKRVVALGNDRVRSFVRLNSVSLSHSIGEEHVECSTTVPACVRLPSHETAE